MLLLFSVFAVIACANAVKPSCDPKALGSSINATQPLNKLDGCVCVSNKGCERGRLEVSSDTFKYVGPLLGTWIGGRDDDHWKIKEPFMASGYDLLPIKEGKSVVFVLCDSNKIFKDALVDFTEKPTKEEQSDLREKYDIEIDLHIANCAFK